MLGEPIKDILIVGGGTAGWMTAAALSQKLHSIPVRIRLVESEAIGTIGVGEATVPHIRFFNEALGFDEAEFMRATKATFKLGIEFRNWARIGDSYIHPFGAFGSDLAGVPFLQHWIRATRSSSESIEPYSLPVQAARLDRFEHPVQDGKELNSTYSYAYQFDAGLYAAMLRKHAEANGVTRLEGRILDVRKSEAGDIHSVVLESGAEIESDFFVDCSGFRALLIGNALGSEFRPWSHWLPCDRAIAVPCANAGPLTPYTRATAREAGWMWRIPLQHRVGNGHVYASAFLSDDEAERDLTNQLEASPAAQPNRLRFQAGKRERQWDRNCVAIGLSSGFLEPLESTSIHLIQLAIGYLIELFPTARGETAAAAEFNRIMDVEYERIRDFLILHYCATERDDTPFWRYCRNMDLPDSLREKIELFRARGLVAEYREGMFLEPSWIAVYLGQRIRPSSHSPMSERVADTELDRALHALSAQVRQTAEAMSSHQEYLARIGALAAA